MTVEERARILFMFRVPTRLTDGFLRAYEQVRYQVAAGVDGHIVDQVCVSSADPEQWLITSEWVSTGHFEAWEISAGHRELIAPMRAHMTDARSMRFVVRAETWSPSFHPEGRTAIPD